MEEKNLQIKKASVIGIIFNFILLVLKLIMGFISKSQAMIADGINSAGDIFASLMSYIGNKISAKPNDDDHPYGHGKAEYIFSEIIGISMIIAAYSMVVSSIKSIINKDEIIFSYYLVIVCLITIITKISLYLYTKFLSKKNSSILIKASMEDHRNDIFVTIGTLIGVISGVFGIGFVDGIIGCCISIWIGYVGINLLRESYDVLMDKSMDKEQEEKISSIVMTFDDVLHIDSMRAKPIGNTYIIMLKISMDGNMTLSKSHKISGKIKEKILNEIEYVSDVIIHVNPH